MHLNDIKPVFEQYAGKVFRLYQDYNEFMAEFTERSSFTFKWNEKLEIEKVEAVINGDTYCGTTELHFDYVFKLLKCTCEFEQKVKEFLESEPET